MFVDRYIHAVNASDLRDDEHHHAPEALAASAHASYHDEHGRGDLGALLCRVRYADGTQGKLYESGARNLAPLLRLWLELVTQKGKDREWIKIRAEWDISAAHSLYKRVADESLAFWLDSRCGDCQGATQTVERRTCPTCCGSGTTAIPHGFVGEKVRDMVSELDTILTAFMDRAASRMRRVA